MYSLVALLYKGFDDKIYAWLYNPLGGRLEIINSTSLVGINLMDQKPGSAGPVLILTAVQQV